MLEPEHESGDITALITRNSNLEKMVRELETRCAMQEKIIESGSLSNMQTLLDQFMTFSRIQLKKISTEALLSEFDSINAELLRNFLDYLATVHSELAQLLVRSKGVYPAEWLRLRDVHLAIGHDLEKLTGLPRRQLRKLRGDLEEFHQSMLSQTGKTP